MVAAKLDQSRVLVTKFHQNRLTLKGRSAGQRYTDTQTNSAENKGPSGLQSGQQIWSSFSHYTLSTGQKVTKFIPYGKSCNRDDGICSCV